MTIYFAFSFNTTIICNTRAFKYNLKSFVWLHIGITRQLHKEEKGRKFVVMTATYDPPRILILLILIERDHLNNWQAVLTVLPLNSPWSGARGIQGEEGITVTITHLPFRALCSFCTAIAVWIASSRGWGQTNMQLAWKTTMDNMEKATMSCFRGLGNPHNHCTIKETIESSPETLPRAGTVLRCHTRMTLPDAPVLHHSPRADNKIVENMFPVTYNMSSYNHYKTCKQHWSSLTQQPCHGSSSRKKKPACIILHNIQRGGSKHINFFYKLK